MQGRLHNGCMVRIEKWASRGRTITLMMEFSICTSQPLKILIIYNIVCQCPFYMSHVNMNHVMKKPVYVMQTTKAQISLGIHAVWSAPFLFAA